MNKSMKLAILVCYKDEREFVVLDTLDAACMRFGYYLGKFREVIIQEMDEVINVK